MSYRSFRAAHAGILLVITSCDATITEPEAPGEPLRIAHVGQINPGGGATPKSDVWGYVDASTGKEYALLGAWGINTLFVIDASDAANPVTVATVNVPAFDMKVWHNYAYTVTGGGDFGRNEGRVVDLTDPTSPVVVGSFPSSHNITIDDHGFMYLSSPGMRIFDLNQDPLNPRLVWLGGATGGHDALVIADLLFDFQGGTGAGIYDVTDRAAPRQLGSIRDPTIGYYHSGSVSKDVEYLFVCDEFAEGGAVDVSIWDIRDVSNPIRVGSITDTTATVHNLYVVGDLAFISHYSAGFRVFDISDPTQPVVTYEYDTSPDLGDGYRGAWGVYPFTPSGHVYVSDIGTGLHIFSVTGSLVP